MKKQSQVTKLKERIKELETTLAEALRISDSRLRLYHDEITRRQTAEGDKAARERANVDRLTKAIPELITSITGRRVTNLQWAYEPLDK